MNFLKNTNNIVLLLLLVVITSLCVLRRTGVVSTAVYFDYAITLILLMA
jgi:hypothetical protein